MSRVPAAFLLLAALAVPAARAGETGLSQHEIHKQMDFAADMAKSGNWGEALFRWERILKAAPDDARVLNNVAVAWETMGEYGKADEAYQHALRIDPNRHEIRENYALFHAFYDRFRKAKDAQPKPAAPPAAPASQPEPATPPPAQPEGDGSAGSAP